MIRKYIFFVIILFLTLPAFSQKPEDPIVFDKNTRLGKLSNGLTYYIRKNAKPEDKAELRLVVNAGSVLEKEGQQGVAHFLEHMAFNGTKNFPKNELLSYLEKAGVRFGADLNATTGFDYTIYMLPIPSNDEKILNNGYQVLRDWAGNLLLEKEEIDKERGIIIEEKRMRQNATQRMYAQYISALTNNSLYGKRIPIGKEEIIKTVPREAFADFYTTWYRPDNMAIIAVGNIDVTKTETLIKSLFSDLKNPANAPVRPEVTPINWHTSNSAKIVSDAENTNNILSIYLAMERSKVIEKWSDYGDDLLAQIVTALFTARLQENFVDPSSPISFGGINPSGSFLKGYSVASLFGLVKENAAQALTMLTGEVLKARQYGFTQSELERVKKSMLKNYEEMLLEKDKTESSDYVNEYIEHFLNKEVSPGVEAEQKFVVAFLEKISLQEVNNSVKKLDLDKPAFILFTAKDAMKNSITEDELIAAFEKAKLQKVEPYIEKTVAAKLMETKPLPGKIVRIEKDSYTDSKKFVLANGITVIYKKTDFKNDEITMKGSQWGGNTNLSPEEIKTGKYFSLLASLGVGDHKAMDMSKIMNATVASMHMSVMPTQFVVVGNSSVKDFEKLLQLFYLKMTNINFDAAEFQGIRSNYASQIGGLLKNPAFKFTDTLNKFRFNYSNRLGGFPVEQEVQALQLDDLKKLYKKFTGNLNGLIIAFSGNIDEDNFESLIQQYIASIPTGPQPATLNKANIPEAITGENSMTFKAGKENKSEINFSYYGKVKETGDKEVQSFLLLGEILQMRANQKLREEMGNTYAPKVTTTMIRPPVSDYSIGLTVAALPDNTERIIQAFDELVQQIIKGKLDEEEIQKAKAQRVKLVENFFKTNNYWSGMLEQQLNYGYKSPNQSDYLKIVEDISKQDIIDVAKKYLATANVLKAVMNPE